jgi:hypothetical protein
VNGYSLQRVVLAATVYLLVIPVTSNEAAEQNAAPAPPRTPSSATAAVDPTAAEIRKAVDEAIRERLKDSKVVEIETSQAIAARLSEWAKLFGFFIGIPLALFATWLGILGFKSYKDFKAVVDNASEDVTRTLDAARKNADGLAEIANRTAGEVREMRANLQEQALKLRTELQEVGALVPQVQALSRRVATIENVVKFKGAGAIAPELKQHLSQTLKEYYDYLKNVGLTLKLRPPTVVIDGKKLNAYYVPGKNQIVAHPELIEHPDVALREFTHHVLGETKATFEGSKDHTGLESGLADYFPASFTGDPNFGKDIWPIFERHHPDFKVPSRNLRNRHKLSEIVFDPNSQHANGTVWGGAWWELRETLGREALDRLLIAAWQSFQFADSAKDIKVFPLEIIAQDSAINDGKHAHGIRQVFQKRGLSL